MQKVQLLVKNCFDVVFALVVLAPSLILSLFIAILIKLDSRGPVFFKQKRLGRDGRAFTMYKFRTMKVDAERERAFFDQRNQADGFLFKMQNDPRETRFGKFLRNTGLDELPQLLNILKGEMSFVGPRPLPTVDVDMKKLKQDPELLRKWLYRQKAKPGLTGWWQISAKNRFSSAEMMKLDEEYVSKYSLGLDLKIIWMTFWTTLKLVRNRLLRRSRQKKVAGEVLKVKAAKE